MNRKAPRIILPRSLAFYSSSHTSRISIRSQSSITTSFIRPIIPISRIPSNREISTMATMQEASTLQKSMASGKPSMGFWQMIPGSNVSRVMARCGVDWILVDQEHGNIDDGAMHEAVAAIAACGVSPIVRVPDNQGWMVKRALDAGAHGILVPLLYTAEDAKKLVTSAKFPPVGQRGFGSPFPMERFHPSLSSADYLKQANSALITMVQIETKEALENVEAIAAVPGVDVLFVGPFDLGNNIGHPIIDGVMHDNLHAAIQKIHDTATAAGKKSGIFCTSGEQGKKYADMGFQVISVATDMMILPQALTGALYASKGLGAAPVAKGPYGK